MMNEADVSRASRIIGIISSEKSMTARDKIITMGTMIVITTVITAGNSHTAAIIPATVLLFI